MRLLVVLPVAVRRLKAARPLPRRIASVQRMAPLAVSRFALHVAGDLLSAADLLGSTWRLLRRAWSKRLCARCAPAPPPRPVASVSCMGSGDRALAVPPFLTSLQMRNADHDVPVPTGPLFAPCRPATTRDAKHTHADPPRHAGAGGAARARGPPPAGPIGVTRPPSPLRLITRPPSRLAMGRRKAVGAAIFALSVAGFVVYAYLLMLSEWSPIVLQLSVMMIVGGILGVVSWIGYTMATTRPSSASVYFDPAAAFSPPGRQGGARDGDEGEGGGKDSGGAAPAAAGRPAGDRPSASPSGSAPPPDPCRPATLR